MRKKPTKKHFIAVWDCPHCGEKDQPLSIKGPYVKEGLPEIWVSFCPNCEMVPEDESEIKGYVSLAEMKSMGWKQISDEEAAKWEKMDEMAEKVLEQDYDRAS